MTAPVVSAVIPVYNGMPELRLCLDSVLAAAVVHGNTEVIVVDNGSTDGTLATLAEYGDHPALRILSHPQTSIGAVRNVGARHALGAVLAFIDSDCVVDPSHFVHIETLVVDHGVSVTGLKVGLPARAQWVEATWHGLHDRWVDSPTWINSGNLVVAHDAYRAVGGFAEDLTTGEDTEFCARLAHAGFPCRPSRLLAVQHLRNPRSLRAFFRKEIWRGLGMFGTFRHSRADKPLLMTFTHGGLIIGAVLAVAFLRSGWPVRLAVAAVLVWLVPAAVVAYRYAELHRVTRPLRSLLLYQTYFIARLAALFWLASGRHHAQQFGTGHAGGAKRREPTEAETHPDGRKGTLADGAPM